MDSDRRICLSDIDADMLASDSKDISEGAQTYMYQEYLALKKNMEQDHHQRDTFYKQQVVHQMMSPSKTEESKEVKSKQ